jgi:O-antigen/teichoic acid export membrane protein
MSNLDNLKQRAFKGVFTLSFRRIILKVIDTFGVIFLARTLPQETFGIFAIVTFIVFTFLAFFSDVGLGAALIQKKEELDLKDIRTTFTIQQLLVTFLMLIAWVVSPYVSNIYDLGSQGMWLIRALSFSIFLTSFKTIPSILLERKLRFDILIIPEILETVAYNGIAVFMAFKGYGVWSLAVAVLARTFLGAVSLNIIAPWKMGWGFDKKSIKGLLSFGVPYQLNSLLALLKDNITPTVIAFFYGPVAVGFLNLAQNISSRPMEIITIVSRITFPTYSRIQHDKARLRRWLEKSTHLMSILYFPAVTGLMVTSTSLLQYLYADKSDKWLPALPALLWLLAAALPVIVTTTYTNALYALGKPKVVLKLMVLYTLMTWGIGLPMIKYVGFVGITITIFIITYLTFPLVIREMNKVVKVNTLNSIRIPLLASLVMASTIFLFNKFFVTSLFTLILAIILGIIVYSILIYTLDGKFLKAEVKNILANSFKKS